MKLSDNYIVTKKLRDLLVKLDIKSARSNRYTLEESMVNLMLNSMNDFGKPDQLLINPRTYAAIKKTLKKP